MISSRFCLFDKPLSYSDAVLLQERLVKARIQDEIPDTLLLLQHPPVITLGRRGRMDHLQVNADRLRDAGIDLQKSSRGGDVTAHGPGQWVLYPILKLSQNEMGAHGYLHALESISLGTAREYGIDAYRREGMAGAWCADGKFSAIGFKFTRWVTMHGLSLNVTMDLSLFDLIVGCGLVGEPVTSFRQVLGNRCPPMTDVASTLHKQAETALKRRFEGIRPENL
jgi:lipoyl(octanoyl) transferase